MKTLFRNRFENMVVTIEGRNAVYGSDEVVSVTLPYRDEPYWTIELTDRRVIYVDAGMSVLVKYKGKEDA